MRVTLAILGWSLDLSLEPTTDEAADETPTNQGDTGHTNVGFIASHEIPDEMPRLGAGQYDPEWE